MNRINVSQKVKEVGPDLNPLVATPLVAYSLIFRVSKEVSVELWDSIWTSVRIPVQSRIRVSEK